MNPLGVTGLSTVDFFFPEGTLSQDDGSLRIDCRSAQFTVRPSAPLRPGGKVEVALPEDLFALAVTLQPGGGGYNSCAALRSVHPTVPIRYLDASLAGSRVQDELDRRSVEARFLGLWQPPRNAVFGCRRSNDKSILKSPLAPTGAAASAEEIEWLLACDAVLVNSAKDRELVTRLASAAARKRLRLYAVLTPSLPSGFLVDAVLPWVHAVIVGVDEAQRVLGVQVQSTPEGELDALRFIAGYTQYANVFLTLGKRGILVSDISTMSIYHVSLRKGIFEQVQVSLASSPWAACGAGDAAAAGVMGYLETGRSLLVGDPPAQPPAVAAAIAGSAAALRWRGYAGSLAPGDFEVRELPYVEERWSDLGGLGTTGYRPAARAAIG